MSLWLETFDSWTPAKVHQRRRQAYHRLCDYHGHLLTWELSMQRPGWHCISFLPQEVQNCFLVKLNASLCLTLIGNRLVPRHLVAFSCPHHWWQNSTKAVRQLNYVDETHQLPNVPRDRSCWQIIILLSSIERDKLLRRITGRMKVSSLHTWFGVQTHLSARFDRFQDSTSFHHDANF